MNEKKIQVFRREQKWDLEVAYRRIIFEKVKSKSHSCYSWKAKYFLKTKLNIKKEFIYNHNLQPLNGRLLLVIKVIASINKNISFESAVVLNMIPKNTFHSCIWF